MCLTELKVVLNEMTDVLAEYREGSRSKLTIEKLEHWIEYLTVVRDLTDEHACDCCGFKSSNERDFKLVHEKWICVDCFQDVSAILSSNFDPSMFADC